MQVFNIFELVDDGLHVFAVVDADFNVALEDTLFTGDGELVYVDIHLRRDDFRDVHDHTYTVDTLDMDGSVEEEALVHVPFGIQDAVAVTRLELVGHRTVALVNLNALLGVDETKDVVTRDGVATATETILTDVGVVDVDGFLAIELLGNDEVVGLLVGLLRLALAQERHQSAPSRNTVGGVLAMQFVDVFLAQQNGLVAQ